MREAGVLTFTSLYLKKPYGCVNSNAQWTTGLFELFNSKLREGYALSRADLLVDTARISTDQLRAECAAYPWIPIATP
jgi:hypothetical protein